MTEKNTTSEKEQFFKNLNKFLVQSGVVAAGIKSVTAGIQAQVEKTKKETEKKVIAHGLMFFGALLAFYGAAQVVMNHFGLSLYTNIILGGIFLLGAVVITKLK